MTDIDDGPAIELVAVVVPARDEAERVDRCLAAVTAAHEALRRSPAGRDLLVRVVVVADACTDGTVARVAEWPDVIAAVSDRGRVGSARAAGVTVALAAPGGPFRGSPVAPERVWIANTDADSAVPTDWLITQLDAARRGAAMVLGTVRPDPAELSGPIERRWYSRHRLSDGHGHVHGANLGVRADWYRAVGGFPPVACGEDAALAAAVVAAGGRVERTGASPVLTSARTAGRAPGGLAAYLRSLSGNPATPARTAAARHAAR